MTGVVIALVLLAQAPQAPANPQPPLKADVPAERSLSPAHDLYYEDSAAMSAEARLAAQDFGACVADRRSVLAGRLLSLDFTASAYDRGFRRLMNANDACYRRRGNMRTGYLLVAGAIAERLIEREDEPVNVRLARAALRAPTPAYSPADQAAICVVRSVPEQVAGLFAAEVAGEAEAAAVQALHLPLAACHGQREMAEINPATLRAILATAAFRELRAESPRALSEGSNLGPEASE